MAKDPLPPDSATAGELLRLADDYRKAAHTLSPVGKKGRPSSFAPWRLVTIHAIELYLNALLLHFGEKPSKIRSLQHDVAARTELAVAKGLVLRKRTASHLATLSTNREYLVVRYSADIPSTLSRVNRLNATLEELAGRVRSQIG
jgi:hypothetical protein